MNDATLAHPTLRARVYWWLERPDCNAIGPKVLEIALVSLILLNVACVIVETVNPIYQRWQGAFDLFERISLSVFVLEYLARLWTAPEDPNIRTRWQWTRGPVALIDLLAILPAFLVLVFPLDLRILRIFRLLRLLKLTRYSPALGILIAVIQEEAGAFFAGFFILMLMLVFAASGAWLVEHQAQPETFGSIPAAMWWAVATLTTVGYGDVTPITVAGQIFGGLVTMIGIGMAALPAGIIATGLNDELHRRRSELRNQFRKALEDGAIGTEDAAEIKEMRRTLGLSHRNAEEIRQQVEATLYHGICKVCRMKMSRADQPAE